MDHVRLLRALSADLIQNDEPDASVTCTESAGRIEAQDKRIAELEAALKLSDNTIREALVCLVNMLDDGDATARKAAQDFINTVRGDQ